MTGFARHALVFATIFICVGESHGAISDWNIPDSKWIQNEMRIAKHALSKSQVQILIVPTQGQENRFDPIERSLITRLLSDRIIHGTGLLVANPTYVKRALGEHLASYPMQEVLNLAEDVRAETVLVSHAEHNRNGSFEFRLSVFSVADGAEIRSKVWSGLTYSDSVPPSVSIAEIEDEIVEFSAGFIEVTRKPKRYSFAEDIFFPESIAQMKAESRKSPLHSAAYLQLLGMLHPSGSFNETRNGLFERSLVELQKVSFDSPSRRYFVARAYAYLGRRPAAIYALGKPKTAHERALLAVMNGNLPALRTEVERIGISAIDFMAWRDLLHLESAYGSIKDRPVVDRFTKEYSAWAPLIHRALQDSTFWGNYSAATTKFGLDLLLPANTTTFEDYYQKMMASGDQPDEVDLTRLLFQHIEALEEDDIASWGASTFNHNSVSELDVLDLAKTTGLANHMRRIEDDLVRRASPRMALNRIQQMDTLFSGHPAIALQKGRALDALAQRSDGAEKEDFQEQSDEAYRNGLMWTGQMTVDAIAIGNFMDRYFPSPEDYKKWKLTGGFKAPETRYREFEWPKGVEWFRIMSTERIEQQSRQCLAYTWTAFECLEFLIEALEKKPGSPVNIRESVFSGFADRFDGNPQRMKFETETATLSGDAEFEIEHLRSQIELGGSDWSLYYSLGKRLKQHGEYRAAQRALLEYPGFSSVSDGVSVSVANNAYVAGSWFYWVGQHELAMPFLQIAASSASRSDSSYGAAARISLIQGDLAGAESMSLARAQRYSSKYALRDLMQLLHVGDQSDVAWRIFDQIQPSMPVAQIWSGALVGHKRAGATIEDIVAWVKASDARLNSEFDLTNSLFHKVYFAPRYVLMAGTMDRAPGPELAKAIDEVQFKPSPVYYSDGRVRYDRLPYRHDALIPTPPNGHSTKQFDKIETRDKMLAEAMSAFLRNDFDSAFERFNNTAYYYFLDEYLAYYAFSAASIGRQSHLHEAIRAREVNLENIRRNRTTGDDQLGYRFDEDLTYAVLAAFDGKHQESIRYLNRALNDRPFIDERSMYPYYEIVDLADRLYERTSNALYREYALDLSRRHTVILPMYSWAYFIVAKYSESAAERITAAASGLSLDPLSHRGSQLPDDVVQEARKQNARSGPPYLNRTEAPAKVGT